MIDQQRERYSLLAGVSGFGHEEVLALAGTNDPTTESIGKTP